MINKYQHWSAKKTTALGSGLAILILNLCVGSLFAQSGYSVQGSYIPQAYKQRSSTAAPSSARPKAPNNRSTPPRQASALPVGYSIQQDYAPEPYPSYQERKPQELSARSMTARSSEFDRAVQADISDLWASDRRQDDRLTSIERKLNQRGGTTTTASTRPYRPSQPGEIYTVQYGDSLSEIATHYGTTKEALRATNQLDSDWLVEGQQLTIPNQQKSSSNPVRVASTSSKVKASSNGTHYVKAGESLSSIANAYGVSVDSLLAANRISNPNVLSVGQRLTIPSKSTYRAPTIVRKTSPKKAASKPITQYVSKPAPTKSYTPASLAPTSTTSKSTEKSSSTLRGVASYRVEQGDTLDSIATTFNTSSEDIRRINALSGGYKPQHGDELVVPSPAPVAL